MENGKRKDLTKEVALLLATRPETRDSDRVLWVAMLRNRGMDNQPIYRVMFDETAPKYETVSRIRRKIQQAYPELRASDSVADARMLNEMRWRSYGRSHKVDI